MRTLLGLVLMAVVALPALANEAQIRKVIQEKLGGATIEGIQRGPLGLWEVRFRSGDGVRILYTDATASHIIIGKIYETRTDRDITEERLRKLNAIKFDSLPLAQAVKVQRGNGKRVLAMFSDPYCPYCRTFEQNLQQIDNITVYVFMMPIIRPELADHSKSVWCSSDKSKAWLDLAMNGKPPAARPSCETPVEKNIELGKKLGVASTPTIFLSNGERVAGALSAADLREMLDKASVAAK
jgi:thiol:disulfide interchange protein DsbC